MGPFGPFGTLGPYLIFVSWTPLGPFGTLGPFGPFGTFGTLGPYGVHMGPGPGPWTGPRDRARAPSLDGNPPKKTTPFFRGPGTPLKSTAPNFCAVRRAVQLYISHGDSFRGQSSFC